MTKVQNSVLASALLLSSTSISSRSASAERDINAPWGDGDPPRGFENWWSDPIGLLEDLDQFDSIYVKFHGCIWSEYGIDNFDDDGENRDGDEEWYQGRTQPFRANAVYSLYGILNGQLRLRKCSRRTYINTFMTNMGADILLNVLGIRGLGNGYGYGNAWCYEVDGDGQGYDANNRGLSGSGDENAMSGTMGCSIEEDNHGFVKAVFEGGYCDGNYFVEETDTMDDYNAAMDGVECEKIWDGTDNYQGVELLMNSSACDGFAYQGRCADPYGLKRRYSKMLGLRSNHQGLAQRFFRTLSWIALLAGFLLMVAAFQLRRKYGKGKRRRRNSRKSKKKKKRKKGKNFSDGIDLTESTDMSEGSAIRNASSDISGEGSAIRMAYSTDMSNDESPTTQDVFVVTSPSISRP